MTLLAQTLAACNTCTRSPRQFCGKLSRNSCMCSTCHACQQSQEHHNQNATAGTPRHLQNNTAKTLWKVCCWYGHVAYKRTVAEGCAPQQTQVQRRVTRLLPLAQISTRTLRCRAKLANFVERSLTPRSEHAAIFLELTYRPGKPWDPSNPS